MRIAICDDNPEAVRAATRHVIRQGYNDHITIFDSADKMDPDELCGYDILFMDIDMGASFDLSGSFGGMDMAKKIRDRQSDLHIPGYGSLPLIIFITGYKEYMSEAFGVYAFDYLVKPVSDAAFDRTYKRAYDLINEMNDMDDTDDILTVHILGEVHSIRISEITYAESISRKNIIHLVNRSPIEYYGSIAELESELPASFFRIHKGFIVNMAHIIKYDRSSVTVEGGGCLMMSKYRYPEFTASYMEYIGSKGREL